MPKHHIAAISVGVLGVLLVALIVTGVPVSTWAYLFMSFGYLVASTAGATADRRNSKELR